MGCAAKSHGQREMEKHSRGHRPLFSLRLTRSQRYLSQFSTCLLLTVKGSVIINVSLLLPSKLAAAKLLLLSVLFLECLVGCSKWRLSINYSKELEGYERTTADCCCHCYLPIQEGRQIQQQKVRGVSLHSIRSRDPLALILIFIFILQLLFLISPGSLLSTLHANKLISSG